MSNNIERGRRKNRSMAKKDEITVKDVSIRTMKVNGTDYICITDIARQKNEIDPNGVIANWMRSRNTIEYLGLWETLHNQSDRYPANASAEWR